MPSTGAGWVNLNQWLGLNADAGQQMRQNAISAANQAANPTGATRFAPPRHAQQGTAWSPETAQSLVHGSGWDAALLGAQMGGQAGGNMKTQQVGGSELSEAGRGSGPKMTKWTDAQIKGRAPSTSTAGNSNDPTMATAGGNPYGTGQTVGTGATPYSEKPSGTSLEGLLNWLTGHGDRNR